VCRALSTGGVFEDFILTRQNKQPSFKQPSFKQPSYNLQPATCKHDASNKL
jgi:hypothetical protein